MKNKIILPLVAIMTLTLAIIIISYNFAWADSHSDKDYCYDQVGDGNFCFDTKQMCRQEQKHDQIAESHCYNKDRE
jgi:hypothetical protein